MEEYQVGSRIRNYTLLELLGRGSAGEVWKATDGNRTLAIKFMNVNLLQSVNVAKHMARLEREVESLRQLQDQPSIPQLHDYDLTYERPYIVMDFIEGVSLDQLIRSGEILKMPLGKRLDLIEKLAHTLSTAHASGIIHRDIKPANVITSDQPYLLDFGISLSPEQLNETMHNIGTAIYMPPDGQTDELGDIYSFVLVAYEVIFGRHAIFSNKDELGLPESMRQIAGQRLHNRGWRLPSMIPVGEVPPDMLSVNMLRLDKIFEKALGRRQERYRNLMEFVTELKREILSGQPLVSPALSSPPAAALSPSRRDEVTQDIRGILDGMDLPPLKAGPARDNEVTQNRPPQGLQRELDHATEVGFQAVKASQMPARKTSATQQHSTEEPSQQQQLLRESRQRLTLILAAMALVLIMLGLLFILAAGAQA